MSKLSLIIAVDMAVGTFALACLLGSPLVLGVSLGFTIVAAGMSIHHLTH